MWTIKDLVKRWRISRSAVYKITQLPEFPAPQNKMKRKPLVWDAAEIRRFEKGYSMVGAK